MNAATEADLRAFHAARFSGAGLILAIVGDVDPAKTIALVEKQLGDIPRGERLSLAKLARTTAGEKLSGVLPMVTVASAWNVP